jgi:hypothetical protein
MQALTVSDLQAPENEPRVRDLELGKRLGFGRASSIRVLIKRKEDELLAYGGLHQIDANPGPRGGRPTQAYLLNEPQALLVCMFAETPQAAEVRAQVLRVFMAWREGRLTAHAAAARPNIAESSDPIAAELRRLAERLDGLERLGLQLAGDHDAMSRALTHASLWSNGRRPPWFFDAEVRTHVLETYRQGTVDDVIAGMRDRFGPARTPSRSALHRFWRRLDALKARRS